MHFALANTMNQIIDIDTKFATLTITKDMDTILRTKPELFSPGAVRLNPLH